MSRNILTVLYAVAAVFAGLVFGIATAAKIGGPPDASNAGMVMVMLVLFSPLVWLLAVLFCLERYRYRLDTASAVKNESNVGTSIQKMGSLGRCTKIGLTCVGLVLIQIFVCISLVSSVVYMRYYVNPGLLKIAEAISRNDPFFAPPTDVQVQSAMRYLDTYSSDILWDTNGERAYLLGRCYMCGAGGVQKNPKRGFMLVLYAADKGHPKANQERNEANDLLNKTESVRKDADRGSPPAIEF
ncbi:MAG: hypothetical protein LBT46_00885 [Planctomycetaceae bacterium]|jgi:hypothetical protein|nr:hypothetical protein [Planctomycetaceae bacterium]